MIKSLTKAAVTTLFCGTALSSAYAKDIDYQSFEALFGEPVTVGATGTPQRASDVPVNMTILTAEDIRRSAARTIPDLLRQVPGVNVRQNSRGSYDVAIRGYNQGNAERILVLVDGRQVYEDFYGLVAWNNIPVALNEIKQIEVIKGPNTALYGFNATSGVINIITYNPRYDDYSNITVSGGTGEYFEGNGTATVRTDKGGVRVTASGYGADHFDSGTAFASEAAAGTGEYNRFFKVNSGYEIVDGVDIGLELTNSESSTNNLTTSNNSMNDYGQENWSAKFSASAESRFGTWDFVAYRNKSDAKINLGAQRDFDTTTDVVQLSDTFKVGTDHTFRLAGEYREASGNAVFDSRMIDYSVMTASALWSWAINDKLSLTNAVRADFLSMSREDGSAAYDRDMDAVSINSGLVYKATEVDTVRLTYARAVDLPSFVEFGQAPSSDISTVHNVGVDYAHTFTEYNTTFSAGVFYQTIEDMQVLVISNGTTNPLDSDAVGGEIALDGRIGDAWSWGIGYAHVATNDSVTGTVEPVIGTSYEDSQSDHMVTAHVGYQQGKWSIDAYGNYMSGYTAYNTNGTEIDDVYLGSIKINYRPMDNINLSLTGMKTLNGERAQSAGQEIEDAVFASMSFTF